MVNDITSDTMLIIYLKEAFTNEFEPVPNIGEDTDDSSEGGDNNEQIIGPDSCYPYDTVSYSLAEGISGGDWSLSNTKAKIIEKTNNEITITIVSAKSGSIDLIYKRVNEEDIVKTITINSL